MISRRCLGLAVLPFAVAWVASTSAIAGIRSIGAVTPAVPGPGSDTVVGDEDATDPDTRGYLLVNDGSTFSPASLIIGDEELYLGEMDVTGDFRANGDLRTQVNIGDGGSTPSLRVGEEGQGFLNINGGASVTLTNSSGDASIGHLDTGVGYVTVDGLFSQLSIGENFDIGNAGTGWLDVLNGGRVITRDDSPADYLRIGGATTGVGTAVVDGTGSLLHVGANLFVGDIGIGTLRIANGGIVDSNNYGSLSTVNVTVGSRGRVEMDGGTLIGTNIDLDGLLGGGGLVRGVVDVDDDAFLELGTGDLLRFEDSVSNQGSITIIEGDLHFLDTMTNNAQGVTDAPGRITLQQGTVRFSSTLTNDGVIASTRGTNDIHGEITNAADIVVASDTVAVFHDSVTNTTGTVDVLPRGNALFLADMSFQSAASLQMAIAGDGTTDESSEISISGAATLGGALTVSLFGGITPSLGETFDLITASRGISGTFATTNLPDLPGNLEFGLIYNPTSVQLAVQIEPLTTIDGDYNQDGIVDAADYTVWRDTFGQVGADLDADGNNNGQIDDGDYSIWRSNFGQVAGSLAAGDGASVPEPSTLGLIAGAMVVGLVCRRKLA